MKKLFIASLVGAIILFVWSFLAWAILPIHLHTYMYTPAQDTLLKVMADHNMESGAYAMPMVDNRNVQGMDADYRKKCDELMKTSEGKPMVSIFYKKEGMTMGPGIMIKGFLIDFLIVLAACILLMPAFAASASFFGRWWLCLVVGLLVSAAYPLINHNWMGVPWGYTVDIIVDIFANWAILGLWLAWYFRK